MLTHTFQNSFDRLADEKDIRSHLTKNVTRFGISFLDEALDGILPIDLVLIGASSGIGKTSLVSDIAYKNARLGKKVYGIFLEAFEGEIELRAKYKLLAREAKIAQRSPNYKEWLHGKQPWLDEFAEKIEFRSFGNVFTKYRGKSYDLEDMKKDLLSVNDKADLIIIDHLHYFDLRTDNENKEMTEIVKTISGIVNTIKKPVILVGHLRKQDALYGELVPGQEDFHGSSNIYKIATKVVTMSTLGPITPERSYTLMRVCKGRVDSSVTQYVARMIYNTEINDYEAKYELGVLRRDSLKRSIYELTAQRPRWFRGGV